MKAQAAWRAAVKVFLVASIGFLACVGVGYLLNGTLGAVWGIGLGLVF